MQSEIKIARVVLVSCNIHLCVPKGVDKDLRGTGASSPKVPTLCLSNPAFLGLIHLLHPSALLEHPSNKQFSCSAVKNMRKWGTLHTRTTLTTYFRKFTLDFESAFSSLTEPLEDYSFGVKFQILNRIHSSLFSLHDAQSLMPEDSGISPSQRLFHKTMNYEGICCSCIILCDG